MSPPPFPTGPSGVHAVVSSPTAPPRLRRDAERNRQRILAAAREVFAERGIDVTLDDIARHADLGVGTVYRRFPSREHLVEALFEEKLDAVREIGEVALGHPDPWNGFVGFLFQTAELLAADRGLRDIMFSRAYGRHSVDRVRERINPVIDRLVARAQADDRLRSDLAATDIPMLEFAALSIVDYACSGHPDLWRRYLTIIVDGLRAHRNAPSPLPHDALTIDEMGDSMLTWRPTRHSSTSDHAREDRTRRTQR